jgi:hypothetical protein
MVVVLIFNSADKVVIDIHELQHQKCIKLFIGNDKRFYFL